jgi:hypothetical protein
MQQPLLLLLLQCKRPRMQLKRIWVYVTLPLTLLLESAWFVRAPQHTEHVGGAWGITCPFLVSGRAGCKTSRVVRLWLHPLV